MDFPRVPVHSPAIMPPVASPLNRASKGRKAIGPHKPSTTRRNTGINPLSLSRPQPASGGETALARLDDRDDGLVDRGRDAVPLAQARDRTVDGLDLAATAGIVVEEHGRPRVRDLAVELPDFPSDITNALLPQADPVFDDATTFDTAVDMLNPQSTIVEHLVGFALAHAEQPSLDHLNGVGLQVRTPARINVPVY